MPRQLLHLQSTPWHITWGTYGTRLHGGERATVDREHNQLGEAFIGRDAHREQVMQQIMNFPPRLFGDEQRRFIVERIPAICERGGWDYRIAAAAKDHVHVLCDVAPAIHGEKVRRLLKRWLGQEMAKQWPLERGQTFWAEEGSNKAIHDESYLNNAYDYILRQRVTPLE